LIPTVICYLAEFYSFRAPNHFIAPQQRSWLDLIATARAKRAKINSTSIFPGVASRAFAHPFNWPPDGHY
jgi:hypothetical protein